MKHRGIPGTLVVLAVALATCGAPDEPPVEQRRATLKLASGFSEETVLTGPDRPTAVRFAPDGRLFVAEKKGIIKVFGGVTDPTPTVFADLSASVFDGGDRGLLGLALHPDFPATPYVYVLYTRDVATLDQTPPVHGDVCAEGANCVVWGRVARLQASGDVMTGAEQPLLDGFGQQELSHSIGGLAFGADGALYVTAGDGAFDDATTPTVTRIYGEVGVYEVRLRVTDRRGVQVISAPLQITVGDAPPPGDTPPVPVIETPSAGTTWAVGDTITFSGHATDAEEPEFPATQLSWTLVMQHCTDGCHAHTMRTWSGVAAGSFVVPDHEYPSYLELVLTATDAQGVSVSVRRRLDPRTVDLTFTASPAMSPAPTITVGPEGAPAPVTRTVIVGSAVSISAPATHIAGGETYDLGGWSDGGAASHLIVAPAVATTYDARYWQRGHRGSGTGLRGAYYNSTNLTGPGLTRTDATVDFTWSGSPFTGVRSDRFSVRWTGQVQPRFTGPLTFHVISDEGARLWVNGQLIVDHWAAHTAAERSGTITLVAGRRYDLRLEHYDQRGTAVARLLWTEPGGATHEVVPTSQLYPKAYPGDLDGNRQADMVLMGGYGWRSLPLAIGQAGDSFRYANPAVGDFGLWAEYATKRFVGDFDGDGRGDVALAGGPGWLSVPVAFGRGDRFTVANELIGDFGWWAELAPAGLVGDLDGDGIQDIAVTGTIGWRSVPIAFGGATGRWTVRNDIIPDLGIWSETAAARLVGDFDGDGRSDVALPGNMGIGVGYGSPGRVLRPASFAHADFALWSYHAPGHLVGDFDGDGKSDIALTGGWLWESVPVALSRPHGTFEVTNRPVGEFGWWAMDARARLAADFDGDGRDDVALAGGAGWGSVPVAFSEASGAFTVVNDVSQGQFAALAAAARFHLVGDFDGDGRADIALLGGGGWGKVPILYGQANRTWRYAEAPAGDFAALGESAAAAGVLGRR